MKRYAAIALLLLLVFSTSFSAIIAQPGQSQNPNDQKPKENTGGPGREVGETVVIPKGPPQKPKRRVAKAGEKPGEEPFAINVSVDLVTIDVSVQDKNGRFIPGLAKTYFRVLEDGAPQQIQTFETSDASMTVVMVVEFNNLFQRFWSETWYQTLTAAHGFLGTLRKEDWVAVVAYDLRPEILQDFTQDKRIAEASLRRLQFPAFSEANLYDTTDDVLSRLNDVAGKKGIVLISSGIDTFSKMNYDQILKKIRSSDVPIYPIGLMQAIRELADARGMLGAIDRMEFLQADNALRTFAEYSGGRAFFPRFYGELPGIFNEISGHMRHQYTISYASTNTARDGKFHKVKIELMDETGKPLKIVDQKGKELKYKVVAKAGYYAPKGEIVAVQ